MEVETVTRAMMIMIEILCHYVTYQNVPRRMTLSFVSLPPNVLFFRQLAFPYVDELLKWNFHTFRLLLVDSLWNI